jgi:hypothetical protein
MEILIVYTPKSQPAESVIKLQEGISTVERNYTKIYGVTFLNTMVIV